MDKDSFYVILPVMPEETRRNKEILNLNVKGLGARRLAKVYNITPQRVSQIIKAQRNKVSPGN
jgi:Mor family transcriptional regulator